jgi:hypothetical protein
MLVHLVADAIPLGLCVTGQQVPQLLIQLGNCLVVSLLGLLEHLGNLLNLHLASCNITRRQDGVSRLRGILETLQRLGTLWYSLGENPTLLGQPFLFHDAEDCNYMREVLLVVPTGEDKYADVGCVGKLDLQYCRFFLGRDDIYHWYVRDGQPLR